MPVRTAKRGSKFAVVDDSGKTFGTHKTRKGANAQASAINLTQLRKEGRNDVPPAPKGSSHNPGSKHGRGESKHGKGGSKHGSAHRD